MVRVQITEPAALGERFSPEMFRGQIGQSIRVLLPVEVLTRLPVLADGDAPEATMLGELVDVEVADNGTSFTLTIDLPDSVKVLLGGDVDVEPPWLEAEQPDY